jgi:SAM-dependent methyltransferase
LIEHIPDWRGLTAEMVRIVRPGGRLAISTPARHGVAQIVKSLAIRTGLMELDTYEYFIPRGQMITELEKLGVRVTSVTDVVLTAPMLPDAVMPMVKAIEKLCERVRPLSYACSTTIYRGEKAA